MVTDIDGDNKGDILIGAPLYSQHNKRETGRVYLFQNVMENLHRKFHGQVFTSKESKVGARFGTSIAMIDIDKNKYQGKCLTLPTVSLTGLVQMPSSVLHSKVIQTLPPVQFTYSTGHQTVWISQVKRSSQ